MRSKKSEVRSKNSKEQDVKDKRQGIRGKKQEVKSKKPEIKSQRQESKDKRQMEYEKTREESTSRFHINFMGLKRYSLTLSAILILIGIVAVVQIATGGANLGIDFAGGTAVQLKFDKPIKIDDARAALKKHDLADADIQEFTDGNKLLIRLKKVTEGEESVADRIIGIFRREFQKNHFEVDSTTEIGPTVGKRLQKDAITAVFIALIGIIIYIAFRFELRFGMAAAIATFHDVMAVLGIFYILHKEINLLIITALLTLAGYSLTDTVVVFDRIREYMRMRRKTPLETLINNGINHVLGRTIVTSITTGLVLVALLFFGGEVIHDFSLALLLGVIVGTYSSVFVASPLLLLLRWRKS